MKIYTRAELGSRPFRTPPSYVALSGRREVTIHYPGLGVPPEDLRSYRAWIEAIHMNQNGWRGVGYNYFVDADGKIGEGCGRDVIGAHSPPHNVDGFGVNVWTANGQPTEAGKRAARELYEYLCQVTGRRLRMGWHGRDFATKCPGNPLRVWTAGGMRVPNLTKPPAQGNTPKPQPKEWTDMASKQEIQDAVLAVVRAELQNTSLGDRIPAPNYASAEDRKKNPTWYLSQFVRRMAHDINDLKIKADRHEDKIDAILRGQK